MTLVRYHSQEHGNTQAMAEAVAEGAREAGAKIKLVNTNEHRFDPNQYRKTDAMAFGAPDCFGYVAGGLKVFADDWYIAKGKDRQGLEGKPYGLFYSHGGGGNVREPFEKLFKYVGGKQVGETVESGGKPTAAMPSACRVLGEKLAGTTTVVVLLPPTSRAASTASASRASR